MTTLDVKASLAQAKATVDKYFIHPWQASITWVDNEELESDATAITAILVTAVIAAASTKKPWLRIPSVTLAVIMTGQLTTLSYVLHHRYMAGSYGMRGKVDVEGPTSSWSLPWDS